MAISKEKKIECKILEGRISVLEEALKTVADGPAKQGLIDIYDREMALLIKRFPESKMAPLSATDKRRAGQLRRIEADLRYYRYQKREAEQVLEECSLDKSEAAIFKHRLKEAEEKIGPLNQKAKRLRPKVRQSTTT